MAKTKEEKYQDKLAKAKVCSICYNEYSEWGNNASPVNSGTCCNKCNLKVVIPARLSLMISKKIIDKANKIKL